MMKIAFFSTKSYDMDFFNNANKSHHFDIHYFDAALTEKTSSLTNGFDAVCIFVNDVLNKKVIQTLSHYKVRFIAIRAAGFNNIDLKACQKNNIKVVRVPAYSPHGVAEHAFALLLSLNRKIHKAYYRIKDNNFSLDGLLGMNLYQKTIGIIGLGLIGKVMASIAQGFGMKVLALDPKIDKAFIQKHAIKACDLKTLLSQADIISLHCPLTPESHHLINEAAINQMKKNVILINTGRGGLIDTTALIQGLKEQKFAGVALDVYEQESHIFFEDHSFDIINDDELMRLTTFPNVLITSHQGFFTHEALNEIATTTLMNLDSLQTNGLCQNEISISA